ncbi:hypothetical protein PTTW11_10692 [Pyrenophora teres f. teres]|uniref:Atrophin-1 multi-domain protein n=1 Tax=Pyrenophora teres f. teres TaxID=97479 RepID=A0A6S6WGS2_9PLEO|nr:hypothetical protein PTTW11_10692 [Pyrenophora teres f. teres]
MSLINRQTRRLLLPLIAFLNPICLPHARPYLSEDSTEITFQPQERFPKNHGFSLEIHPASTFAPTTFSPIAADTSRLVHHVVLCGLGDRAELYFPPSSSNGSIHRARESSEAYILFDLSNGVEEGGAAIALRETIARVIADEEEDRTREREGEKVSDCPGRQFAILAWKAEMVQRMMRFGTGNWEAGLLSMNPTIVFEKEEREGFVRLEGLWRKGQGWCDEISGLEREKAERRLRREITRVVGRGEEVGKWDLVGLGRGELIKVKECECAECPEPGAPMVR